MECDILIRSYWRDFQWLELCLSSIKQYCTGFRQVIVVIPESSRAWSERRVGMLRGVRAMTCEDYEDDYLGQQVTKLHADLFTDAGLICHVDSDCVFRRPTTPDDVAPGAVPRIYTRPLADLPRHWPWADSTHSFLGWRPTHDFMQCPPFVYPSWLYREVRQWALETKRVELATWVLAQPARGFSEFNVLGAFAYARYRNEFIWTRACDIGDEERTCSWHWSWEGVETAMRRSPELRALESAALVTQRHG